jgi:bla regulator protein blaR1
MPEWQKAAGGQMSFDVASLKQAPPSASDETANTNIPLGPQEMFEPTGGLLSAKDFPLWQYIIFAYRLSPRQVQDARSQLPKWAINNRYDIEARASGNPTKDQFRLMMQALLAERFKLALHYETRQLPVYALVLNRPGKLGPQFQPHPDDVPCSTKFAPDDGPGPTVAGGFPETCGVIVDVQPSAPGRFRTGARNMALPMIADSLLAMWNFGNPGDFAKPILDRTGLAGKFDFVLEWSPQLNGPLPPGSTFQPDESGPTFLQALKEQLGLKLVPQTGPVDVLVIDHVEEPSAN